MSAADVVWVPAGFFVLRTPLLPYDALDDWQADGGAPGADAEQAEARQSANVLRLAARPDVREALLLASRDLSDALATSGSAPPAARRRLVLALARYLARMASRPTPFGLLAGYSVGLLAERTCLRLAPAEQARKGLELGLHFLGRLAERLATLPATRLLAPLRVNSSLYEVAGQQRYVEVHPDAHGRGHELQALRGGPELRLALVAARGGRNAAALADELAARLHAPEAAARDYVERLVTHQVLAPDVEPAVTSADPAAELAARLCTTPGAEQAAADLTALVAETRRLSAGALGASATEYATLEGLATRVLGTPLRADEALHVVLRKPAPELTLERALMPELLRGAEALRRLFGDPALDPLSELRERFVERYEGRFVPLLEALDHELGHGLAGLGVEASDDAPLLRDLGLPATLPVPRTLPCHAALLERVGRVLEARGHELVLSDADVESLALPRALPLPDAFAVVGHAVPDDAPDGLRFSLYSVLGPSGARLLGRFCQGDARLEALVRAHLRAEEALRPEAVFAELASRPRGRAANIVARPVLRAHEIPFLATSRLPAARQIAAGDLLLGVRDERFVLWSRGLGREVLPRVTNAHNVSSQGVSVYRFLAALQTQGVAGALHWDWGPLAALPFLPRVRFGGLALSRATWHARPEELRGLARGTASQRLSAARAWAASRRLPRRVAFAQADHELLVDFENVLSVDAFLGLASRAAPAVLRELLPGPERPAVRAADGGYANEVVLPFVRATPRPAPRRHAPPDCSDAGRRYAPGGEWLYVKLYTGYATADRLLGATLLPLARRLAAEGRIDAWFFVRYHDPTFHLRVRFQGSPEALWGDVLREVNAACAPLLQTGFVARLQLDTYVREVERYGGAQGLALSEQVFWHDSEAVAELLPLAQAEAELRWQLAYWGADALLDDLGLELEAKTRLLALQVELYGREFRVDKSVRERLAAGLRARRAALQARSNAPGAWQAVYLRRSERLRAPLARLHELRRRGELGVPLDELAQSHVHMHLNRWFRTAPRAQELVLYDLMHRVCLSQAARARQTAPTAAS